MLNIYWLDNFFFWLEKQTNRKNYVYYLVFILVTLSLFLATPKYSEWYNRHQVADVKSESNSTNIERKKNTIDVLNQVNVPSNKAIAPIPTEKINFNLTIRFLIEILKIKLGYLYILHFLIGPVLLFLIYYLAIKILDNPVSATFLTAGLVFIYFGRACFVDGAASPVGWAFLFLILALSVNRAWLIFTFALIATLTDERAFISLPIVFLFHCFTREYSENSGFSTLILKKRACIAIIASIITYMVLRLSLSLLFNIHNQYAIYSNLFYFNILNSGFGIWSYMEGFWLIGILALGVIIFNKNYTLFGIILAQLILFSIVAHFFYIKNVTQTGSFLVPMIFVFLSYLKKHISAQQLKTVLFFCMFFSFIFPAYYLAGGINNNQPFIIDLCQFLFNKYF